MPGFGRERCRGRGLARGLEIAKEAGEQYYIDGTRYGGGHVYDVRTGKLVESGRRGTLVEKYGKK